MLAEIHKLVNWCSYVKSPWMAPMSLKKKESTSKEMHWQKWKVKKIKQLCIRIYKKIDCPLNKVVVT